jgi:hypothetical protein
MKLAYNKATESLESNFGWSKIYDDLIVKLKKTLKLRYFIIHTFFIYNYLI